MEPIRQNNLICKEKDGSFVKGQKWWGRQSYFVDLVNEWNTGISKQRIDALINAFPQLQETGILYFDNITQYPASPYFNHTSDGQRNIIKKIALYLKNKYSIQLIAEYGDKQLYGYLSQGITWDWGEYSLGINPMEIPPYFIPSPILTSTDLRRAVLDRAVRDRHARSSLTMTDR